MGAIDELERSAAQILEAVAPAVVGIGQRGGAGTGLVIGPDQVLTNAHNLRGAEVTVSFADGRREVGQVAGADVDGDLAVLTVPTEQAPVVEWAADAAVHAGKVVFALANPRGRGVRLTFGLVSATDRAFRGPRGRLIGGSIEHTSPLAHGSSGGPLVDADGKLVGVNTNRLAEGFYLALPADTSLRSRIDALSRGQAPRRARLGVGLAPEGVGARMRSAVGLPERDGLLVRMVEDHGPADRAGIRTGDLIVEAAGQPVVNADQLHDVLDGLGDGDSLALRIVRGTDELGISVAFGPATAREQGSA